ncbi:MAG: hypothetical protein AAB917_03160 [Patescibacteria group bacterium]
MIKMWFLIRHSTRHHSYWAQQNDPILRDQFVLKVALEKRMHQDWRDTIRYWYDRKFPGQQPKGVNQRGVDRVHKQLKKINDLVDKAIRYGYLKSESGQSFKVTGEGREFLKALYWFEATMKEFPTIFKLIGGGVLWEIIKFIFSFIR